jgi:NitT/TauT family transport system substrate-binding protein
VPANRTSRSTLLRRGIAVLTALPLLTLAACGYGSNSDDSDSNAKVAAGAEKIDGLDSVKIGYFGNLTHATALVGNQKGFFQKELGATKAKYSLFNAGPSEIEALNSGSIDIGWIGPSPSINGYTKSNGKSLKIISGSASGGVKLVVNPKKIKSLKDLKGKKIATPQLGNTQDVALRAWLKQNGLNADQQGGGDVSVLPQDNATAVQAFAQGAIDGAWVPEPNLSKMVLESKGKLLVNEKDLWPNGQFVTTHLIVSQNFLKKYPTTVKKLLQGHIQSVKYIQTNNADAQKAANAQIAALSGKPLKDDILAAAFKNLTFTNDPIASSLFTSAQHAEEVGLLKPVDLKGIYDLGPLNALLKADGQPEVSDAAAS